MYPGLPEIFTYSRAEHPVDDRVGGGVKRGEHLHPDCHVLHSGRGQREGTPDMANVEHEEGGPAQDEH